MEELTTSKKCLNKDRNNEKFISQHPNYKNVTVYRNTKTQVEYYRAKLQVNNKIYTKDFDDDKKAAIWVDLKLIEYSRNPVNVLKRK